MSLFPHNQTKDKINQLTETIKERESEVESKKLDINQLHEQIDILEDSKGALLT